MCLTMHVLQYSCSYPPLPLPLSPFPSPPSLSPLSHKSVTAEKAREILKEVKEAQETFKTQREAIKLEAEVCM